MKILIWSLLRKKKVYTMRLDGECGEAASCSRQLTTQHTPSVPPPSEEHTCSFHCVLREQTRVRCQISMQAQCLGSSIKVVLTAAMNTWASAAHQDSASNQGAFFTTNFILWENVGISQLLPYRHASHMSTVCLRYFLAWNIEILESFTKRT